ncbi:MAG: PorP/SprF family type IX secretion system membrane protein [Chitinophagales bacterium]|nr:PorP/SprF family type IX secretion system membrane protein [Chitinophagales bacterium]MDW8417894.1 PorP/SprF family type IX secretion system membrane protein [Chitinophagales bacterium]
MVRLCKTVLAAVLFTCKAYAQEVEMSQYFVSQLHTNPAMAGISYGPRITASYRNQWSAMGDGFNGGFTTYMAGFDMYITSIRGGVGLLFTGDQIANNLYATYKASIMYAQQFKINRKMAFRLGISGTYVHARIRWNELLWSDMIDPYTGFFNNVNVPNPTGEIPPGRTVNHQGDVGAGALFFTEKLYVGLAVNNLTMRKNSFTGVDDARVPMRLAAHFGGNILIRHRKDMLYNIWLSPNVIFINQGRALQVQGTFLTGISFAYFGMGARHSIYNMDAVIAHLGFKKGKFRVGYSYDYTVSKLINRTGGTHELTFTFNWSGEDNSLNPKALKGYVPCPDILR